MTWPPHKEQTKCLLEVKELPEQVFPSDPTILMVCINYRKISAIINKEPVYGGAIANYPKTMDFKLDRSSLGS